jgi:hypothetical protein
MYSTGWSKDNNTYEQVIEWHKLASNLYAIIFSVLMQPSKFHGRQSILHQSL